MMPINGKFLKKYYIDHVNIKPLIIGSSVYDACIERVPPAMVFSINNCILLKHEHDRTNIDDRILSEFHLAYKNLVKRNGRVNSAEEHDPILDKIELMEVN